MKKKPQHGDTKLSTFNIKTPYGKSKVKAPVEWDEAIGDWIMTPEAHQQIESEKARLMLTPEFVDVQVGHDPHKDRYWLSVTPPCGRATTTLFDLTHDDLLCIYHGIDSFIQG